MIHFPDLKATKEQLQNPIAYWGELPIRIAEKCRDLKDTSTYQLKIIDYGFSKILDEGIQIKTAMGVPFTKAPETEFDANEAYDERVDVWSIGVCYYILLTNKIMFDKTYFENGIQKYMKDFWYLNMMSRS